MKSRRLKVERKHNAETQRARSAIRKLRKYSQCRGGRKDEKKGQPGIAVPEACLPLLLGGASFGGGVSVFLGEALDAAGGVDQFLLAGEERVAIGADFHAKHVALNR